MRTNKVVGGRVKYTTYRKLAGLARALKTTESELVREFVEGLFDPPRLQALQLRIAKAQVAEQQRELALEYAQLGLGVAKGTPKALKGRPTGGAP